MQRLIAVSLLVLGLVCSGTGISFAQEGSSPTAPRKVVSRVEPEYPQLAHTAGITGTVKVEALVSTNGTVKSVQIKGGHPVLAQAAAGAIAKWKWEPAAHETREPVEVKFSPQ